MDVREKPTAPIPRVDAIGIVQYPAGYSAAPRQYAPSLRVVATAVLIIFALVVVVTTGVSFGQYCLTSDGGDWSQLTPWLERH